MPRPDRQEPPRSPSAGRRARCCVWRSRRATRLSGASWPWVTFAANIAGAFLLGYFATRLQERLPLSAYRRPLLGTGLLRRADHVLDDAARAAAHARRATAPGLPRLRGGERRGRLPCVARGHGARAARQDDGVSASLWAGVGAARRRRGAGAVPARRRRLRAAGRDFPFGHVRRQRQRRVRARPARRRRARRRRARARRPGLARLVHDVLTWMFESQRLAEEGEGALGARQRRRQPRRRPRRGRAGAAASSGAAL